MLCSDCHKEIKPVVVLDIDGTLGDYHGHFHNFAEAYEGRGLDMGYDGSCELHEWYSMTLTHYREVKLAYRQGGMKRSMPAFAGAHHLASEVQAAGAEVWIATTRPYLRLDNIDPDTREWLDRNGIKYNGLLYGDDKYAKLIEIVDSQRIVAVLDDLPEMCVAAYERIGPNVPLLRVAEHNEYYRMLDDERRSTHDVLSFERAYGLREALCSINSRLEAWRLATAAV